ncbi:hypothetical protein OJAV_G00086840 [Oryzias javanicus]|uniref:Uncharacterized protein n=1 Tax=Oryzias javanicus TaxID=123683 RepID=A0A437CZJ9_ORYJA|nr:hypothetical protein OJAV_G00086840 [Oryzias javanicus]
MPIASGATGRVDVGIDTNKRWAPGGAKRNTFPVIRHYDSYLLRHQELQKLQNKNRQDLQTRTESNDHENDGAKEETPQIKDTVSVEKSSKSSKLCIIL